MSEPPRPLLRQELPRETERASDGLARGGETADLTLALREHHANVSLLVVLGPSALERTDGTDDREFPDEMDFECTQQCYSAPGDTGALFALDPEWGAVQSEFSNTYDGEREWPVIKVRWTNAGSLISACERDWDALVNSLETSIRLVAVMFVAKGYRWELRTYDAIIEGANRGNPSAQYAGAGLYLQEGEYTEGMTWLAWAANRGHLAAQCDLGILYAEV